MKHFFIVLFLSLAMTASANKDSLLTLFKSGNANPEDLCQLAMMSYATNLDSGRYFAELALDYAQKTMDEVNMGEAYYQLGDYFYYGGQSDSVLRYYHLSLQHYLKTDQQNSIAGVYNDIGQVYQSMKQQDSARLYFDFALEYIDRKSLPEGYYAIMTNIATTYYHKAEYAYANDQYFKVLEEGKEDLSIEQKGSIYSNIGLNYKKSGNYKEAIDYYTRSMQIDDSLGLEMNLAVDYINIGGIYYQWKKFDVAIEHFQKGQSIYQKLGHKCKEMSVLSNTAACYRANKNYDMAIQAYTTVKDTSVVYNCIYELASAYHGLGLTYYKTHDYQKANEYEIIALPLFRKVGTTYGIINTQLAMGRNYMALKQWVKAKYYLQRADSLAKNTGSIELIRDVVLELAKLYQATGDNKKGIAYYEKFIALNDSMFSINSHRLVTEFQIKLDNLDKERMLEQSEYENAIKQGKIEHKNRLIWFLSIGAFVLLLLSLLIYRLFVLRNKSYQVLFEKNKQQLELQKQASKETSSRVDRDLADELKEKLIQGINQLMSTDKIFLDQELNASKMAEILETNTTYLSKTINEHYECNFNNFVNRYRVDEAQELILSGKFANYTIEAISKECGFKSKTTFNTAFKKFTGLTPSYYIANKDA